MRTATEFKVCRIIWNICIVCTCLLSLLAICTMGDDDVPCDIDSATNTCQAGFCCIRNTSAFSHSYCSPVGEENDGCATYKSKYICPCADKFFCEQSANDTSFGNCKPKKVDIPCSLTARNSSCPLGMCCVRDEFLFSYTYCKALGGDGNSCVIKPSYFECPCRQGFICDSNQQGSHVSSLFGSCRRLPTSPQATTPQGTTPQGATSPAGATTEAMMAVTTETDITTDAPSQKQTTGAPTQPMV